MARISEFEQSGADTLEVAISASEFSRLGSSVDPFVATLSYYARNGGQSGSDTLSTNPTDWTLDPDTGEYFITIDPTTSNPGLGNHNGITFQGIALSTANTSGPDTVEVAYMFASFGSANATSFASTVTSSTFVPVGTVFTPIEQDNIIGTGSGATIRWDAPDIDTPVVSRQEGLGDTGTGPSVICFVPGTCIKTPHGYKPIETLQRGSLVTTPNGDELPVLYSHHRVYAVGKEPIGRPVVVEPQVLGNRRRVTMSAGHALAIDVCLPAFQTHWTPCLARAALLVDHKNIHQPKPEKGSVAFLNIFLDRHAIMDVEGLEAESMRRLPQEVRRLSAKERPKFLDGSAVPKNGYPYVRQPLLDVLAAISFKNQILATDDVCFKYTNKTGEITFAQRMSLANLYERVNAIRKFPDDISSTRDTRGNESDGARTRIKQPSLV